jgi:hypothetical protein
MPAGQRLSRALSFDAPGGADVICFCVREKEGSMKRFLIFLFLFPAVATVSFFAVVYVLTGAVVDSLSGPGIMYLLSIGPGLVLALVDWLVAKTPIPTVIGTTLIAYGALVLFFAWDGGVNDVLALGLIGAIPAAVSSWLSSGKPNGRLSD